MCKRIYIFGLAVLLFIGSGSCVEMKRADETWESPGPIKIRLTRKYYLGNDYYFFDAFQIDSGRWSRIMRVWRDTTGSMPVENIRLVNAEVACLFLAGQVAVTNDGGKSWFVFNMSKYFDCGWDGALTFVM